MEELTGAYGHRSPSIVEAVTNGPTLQPRVAEASLNGPAADTDPNVSYTYGYGLSGSAASYARLEKITLPGGRQVYYSYETGGQFGS